MQENLQENVPQNARTQDATSRKISLFGPQTEQEPIPPADPELTGTRVIDLFLLGQLILQMACPKCLKDSCRLQERRRMGLNSSLVVVCSSRGCGHKIFTNTSPHIGKGKKRTSLCNIMMVAVARNCGVGYEKLVKLLSGLNIPKALHVKTFQHLTIQVHRAAMAAAAACMREAAAIVHSKFVQHYPDKIDGENVRTTVIYDGTWHRRGHVSHHGVGVAIDLETGLVIDFEVLSNYCHGCATGPRPTDAKYNAWRRQHAGLCQKNYHGSANSMEVGSAKRIFARSKDIKLIYENMLCDGDAKTVASVNEMDPYGFPIQKEDCVNHVAKRMYKAILALIREHKGRKPPLNGKGRCTQEVQDKLPRYYATALKDNAPDIEAMKNAVYASLFHMVSTDDDPHHTHCPPGASSWCHFKRWEATGEDRRPHKPTMHKDVAKHLLPIYERMTNPALLERCSRMKTQNANECFNAQIWRRCPKTDATSLRTVQTATALAVLEFNLGPEGYHRVLEKLGISPGVHVKSQSARACVRRVKRAMQSETAASISKRKKRKINKNKQQENYEQAEGNLYESGAFNV